MLQAGQQAFHSSQGLLNIIRSHLQKMAMGLGRDIEGALVAVIADEDTITGFLLAGVGDIDIRKKSNFLVVDSKTTVRDIEAAFKDYTSREDIAIVLISQPIANMIRHVVSTYNKPVPALLEIPSKDSPYDPNQDSLLRRVKHLLGLS